MGFVRYVTYQVRRLQQTPAGQGGSCSLELAALWGPHLLQLLFGVVMNVKRVTRGMIDWVRDTVGRGPPEMRCRPRCLELTCNYCLQPYVQT